MLNVPYDCHKYFKYAGKTIKITLFTQSDSIRLFKKNLQLVNFKYE